MITAFEHFRALPPEIRTQANYNARFCKGKCKNLHEALVLPETLKEKKQKQEQNMYSF